MKIIAATKEYAHQPISRLSEKTEKIPHATSALTLWRRKYGKKIEKWNDVGTIRKWRDSRQ